MPRVPVGDPESRGSDETDLWEIWVAQIRFPRPMLSILTSPGYLFQANVCGKTKSTQVLSTYYLSMRHCREKPRPVSLHLQVLRTVWAMRYRLGREEVALVHVNACSRWYIITAR